jgi:hypothetical protein
MYEQGAGAISAQSAGVGVGAGGLGVGVASTRGTTITNAAQRLRPPFRPLGSGVPPGLIFIGSFVLALVSIAIAPYSSGQSDFLAVTSGLIHVTVFVGILFLGIVATVRKLSDNTKKINAQHTVAMTKWQALWYCRRCAHSADGSEFQGGDTTRAAWAP